MIALLSLALSTLAPAFPGEPAGGLVERVLSRMRPELAPELAAVLDDPAGHRLQILVGEVARGTAGEPVLVRHGYRVDAEYFYPASAVKLAAATAACERLRRLEQETGVDLDLATPLRFHPLFPDEELEDSDPDNLHGGTITVGHCIRQVCLVSDNRAYNRLYELVGHRELNEYLARVGLTDSHLTHRLSEFRGVEDQRRTPRIELLAAGGTVEVPERSSDLVLHGAGLPGIRVGRAQVRGGELLEEPLDCTHKNRMSLVDLQDMLVAVVRPDLDPTGRGMGLTEDERRFVQRALGELPRESDSPRYDADQYPDEWVKFLLPGARRVVPGIRILNKVGRAYGFSIENAWLVDEPTGRGFFLSVVLYTNPDGILNNGVYAYGSLADPLLEALGEAFTRELLGGGDRADLGPAPGTR